MEAPKFENLTTDQLDSAEGLEVVTSRVSLPPETQLPRHTHPGEEFAYIIDGSLYLWVEGDGETRYVAGDTAKVSMNTVHTVRTGDEGVTLVAFRVHKIGEPERTLVDS